MTTAPAATRAPSPIVIGPRTFAPAPMTTLLPTVGAACRAGSARCRASRLIEQDIITDFRRLTDDDAHTVVDRQPPPEDRTRVDPSMP